MKLYCVLVILFFLTNCSFDNKTGIWKDANSIKTGDKSPLKDFKKISTSEEIFNTTINLEKKFKFKLSTLNQSGWNDLFYNNSNNFENFKI